MTENNRWCIENLCAYADRVFGEKNWSHDIKSQSIDSYKVDNKSKKERIECITTVQITLCDGRFHQGIGYSERILDLNEVPGVEIRKVKLGVDENEITSDAAPEISGESEDKEDRYVVESNKMRKTMK
ncbi:hypothetical protein KQX54_000796 [Cotesia glomerata]|uniref:Uncharacterized protein n=1 Tax=Cotesia glomerata TaxID=32391 RepID=A0AAV7IZ35_COTGL|nr:hypothetical protein KQX54_000796 [Cotesia glomerata]